MSTDTLEGKIVRLRQELEELSAKHRQQLRQRASSPERRMRKLAEGRAQILERRIHELGEMLGVLLRGEPDPHSSHAASESMVATQRS